MVWVKRVVRWALVIMWVLVSISACNASPAERNLHVAAASSLSPLMDELLKAYERTSPVDVVPVIGSSGKLAQQIANGAPYDVFMSANTAYVEQLQQKDLLLPESRVVYATGVLVLAFRPDSPLTDMSDLVRDSVARIAIANPEVAPYGQAAKQALQQSGLWNRVRDKLIMAETVRQATQFVETGNVDAALIALSTVDEGKLHVIRVDPALYDPILQEAAIVRYTPYRQEAQAFLDFLQSPEAQAIFTRHGFRLP